MESNAQTVPKGERIYLLNSRIVDLSGKLHSYIKIGCTCDMRARMKHYETYNPSFECSGSFTMPNRECSEAIEDALLMRYAATRQKKTEWFEVSDEDFARFIQLSSFKDVKAFVGLDAFFNMKIEVYISRSREEEKPNLARHYERKAEHYRALREMIG